MAPISVDGKGGGFKQPEGVSCERKQILLVADTGNGRLLKYSITGQAVTPVAEFVLPQLPYPIRVQVNSKGEIFALDGKLRKIGRVAASGEFLGYVDPSGLSSGNVVLRSFRIDRNDNLYLLDVSTSRVIVLDPAGKVQKEIPFSKETGFFSDLAVDEHGNIFLIDSVARRVFSAPKNSPTLSPLTGSLKQEMSFPTGIAVDSTGRIFVVDQNGSGIVILGQDGSFRGRQGSMGWKEGYLRYPSQICINEDGDVFIADRGNNRIEVFSLGQ